MITILFFVCLQLLVTGYTLWRGGAPERYAGLALALALAASIATPLMPHYGFDQVNWPMLYIDASLLLGLVAIALFADRFWPMWLAAVQLVTVGAHWVRAYDAAIVPEAYWVLVVKAGYFMLPILVAGTIRHRDRAKGGMLEHDWTMERLNERAAQDGSA